MADACETDSTPDLPMTEIDYSEKFGLTDDDYDSEKETGEFEDPLEEGHRELEETFKKANLLSLYPKRSWRQRAW